MCRSILGLLAIIFSIITPDVFIVVVAIFDFSIARCVALAGVGNDLCGVISGQTPWSRHCLGGGMRSGGWTL